MRSLEVTDELLAAAEHRLQYTRDDGLLACLARAIVAQASPEAPATSCRGCNHERHPSLSCGECERAGNVCTGLATHRSVGTAPTAQAGLPLLGSKVAFDEDVAESCRSKKRPWVEGEVVGHHPPGVFVVRHPSGRLVELALFYEGKTWRRLQAAEPQGCEGPACEVCGGTTEHPLDSRFPCPGPVKPAQRHEPSAKVAVTTENIEKWAAGRFGWGHDTYRNSLLRECCDDDIRANLARVQAEHAREREADRRRVEELETKLAELARATRVYLSLCSCEMLQGPEADIEDALAQAESDGPAKPAPWQVTEQSTIADLRRQLVEAQAEVADLLPRLDAAALENTQLGRERDGARNELAVMREDYERVLLDAQIRFVQAEQERSRWFGELVLVAQAVGFCHEFCHESDGRPDYPGPVDKIVAQVKEYERKAEQCDDLRAKVERRTVLVEQAVGGRRSNWTLSKWFDWEHTALAELATDDQ